jgi:hypothetical protein
MRVENHSCVFLKTTRITLNGNYLSEITRCFVILKSEI